MGQLAVAFNHLTNRLQESQASTEGERRKLESVLENMTDGVISTDRKGRVVLINDAALRMLRSNRGFSVKSTDIFSSWSRRRLYI